MKNEVKASEDSLQFMLAKTHESDTQSSSSVQPVMLQKVVRLKNASSAMAMMKPPLNTMMDQRQPD